MGFVDPGNVQFITFMQHTFVNKELDEKFFREHGFYEQSHDFFDVWFDNDVSDVQISFLIQSRMELDPLTELTRFFVQPLHHLK
jgi:hypothetical protein